MFGYSRLNDRNILTLFSCCMNMSGNIGALVWTLRSQGRIWGGEQISRNNFLSHQPAFRHDEVLAIEPEPPSLSFRCVVHPACVAARSYAVAVPETLWSAYLHRRAKPYHRDVTRILSKTKYACIFCILLRSGSVEDISESSYFWWPHVLVVLNRQCSNT